MNEKTKNILSIIVDYVIDFVIFFGALLITDKLPLHTVLEILLGAVIAVALIALKEYLVMKFTEKKTTAAESSDTTKTETSGTTDKTDAPAEPVTTDNTENTSADTAKNSTPTP